jgi:hypothetical protein
MNQTPDDKALNEYMSGQSPVSARYRELPADDVPPELDAAILAQAKAVIDQPTSSRKLARARRWSVPVTLAATFVLVVSLIIKNNIPQMTIPKADQIVVTVDLAMESPALEEQLPSAIATPETSSAVKLDMPPFVAKPPAQSVTPPNIEERKAVANAQELKKETAAAKPAPQESFAEENEFGRRVVSTDTRPPAAAPTAPPAPVIAMNDSTAGASQPFQATSAANEAEKSQEQLRRAARTQATEVQLREANPERWLEHIRQLRKKNKKDDADREWKTFRERYPNYKVEDNDIARGNTP